MYKKANKFPKLEKNSQNSKIAKTKIEKKSIKLKKNL